MIVTTPSLAEQLGDMGMPAETVVLENAALDGAGVDQADLPLSEWRFKFFSELAAPVDRVIYLSAQYHQIYAFQKAGFRTAWLNPEGFLVKKPRHDLDLVDLKELKDQQRHLDQIPIFQQCCTWLDQWQVPENVRRHTTRVADLAYALAVALRVQGVQVDPVLTHRGGLLHDLDKIATLSEPRQHSLLGADFIEKQGYQQLSKIIRSHVMHAILERDESDWTWEERLVYFCDKLVEGDQLVSFPVRLAALKKRYPDYQLVLDRSAPAVFALSERISSILSISNHEKLISYLLDIDNIYIPLDKI